MNEYKNNKDTKDLIQKVIEAMKNLGNSTNLAEVCPISIINIDDWEWAQGVGLYGLIMYYNQTKQEEILEFLTQWYDKHIETGLPDKNVNTMCPMLTLSYLCDYVQNDTYEQLCQEWAEWIMNEMPRTQEQGLQHIVSGGINKEQLWDDTLFMTVLFLAKMGVKLGRQDYIQESIRQFLIHIKYLVDKETGLLYHGWTFEGRHNFAQAKWGRGNCWFTAGIPDYLDIVSNLDKGVKTYLIETLLSQIETLKKLQAENGMWHTLLDDPTTYVETSATAGFAYGILKAVRKGYIDESFKEVGLRAATAVMERIDEDGIVAGVSYGTGMGSDLEYYKNIPICPMTYGQALTVMMLTEVER